MALRPGEGADRLAMPLFAVHATCMQVSRRLCFAVCKLQMLLTSPTQSLGWSHRRSLPVEQLFQMPTVTHNKTWYSLDYGRLR